MTFIIHSPEPPERLPPNVLTAKEPIWIVKRVGADEAPSPDKKDLFPEVDRNGRMKSKVIAERMKTFDNRLTRFGSAARTSK